ncbi:GNAT family N-acetyltransferase [Emticicia sp. BO119]|uniref:GNAT family N-acetyltransferase n=1 Tax=Emticicia sp. BO119 TaxID=2757768 RepID=UPI0015F06D42|nr:GNAT family N-acetyltransferase [Emticicia sp. BO119]MBA4851058.1 GNAT family N-acetyltransferase [Emticicia sp. BO119]
MYKPLSTIYGVSLADNIRLVRAESEHVGLVAEVFDAYRQYYGQVSDMAGAKRFLAERIANQESVIFLALADNQPLGFTQLYPMFSSVSMRRSWTLNDLFVQETLRSKGIGKALLATAQQFISAQGHKGLLLETTPDNTKAQRLYEGLGWVREQNYYYFWQA